MENIIKFFGKQLRRREFWIKVLFIAIASMFWLLIKLSKSGYVTSIEYPVLYENIPQNKVLVSQATHTVTMRISSFGFRLLGYELNNDNPLRIDVKRQARKAPNKPDIYYWLPNLYTDEFESQLDGQTSLLRMEPDTVYITLSEISKKQVPVIPQLKLSYSPSFEAYGSPEVKPKMVTISGPNIYLDSITQLKTLPISQGDVNALVQKKMRVKMQHKMILVNPKTVQVKQDVSQVTEKVISVPVRLTNVPKKYKATIIPSEVKVSCKVTMREVDIVTSRDIEVICDFAQLKEFPDRKRLLLKVVSSSKRFTIVDVSQNTVDFLLFKK